MNPPWKDRQVLNRSSQRWGVWSFFTLVPKGINLFFSCSIARSLISHCPLIRALPLGTKVKCRFPLENIKSEFHTLSTNRQNEEKTVPQKSLRNFHIGAMELDSLISRQKGDEWEVRILNPKQSKSLVEPHKPYQALLPPVSPSVVSRL